MYFPIGIDFPFGRPMLKMMALPEVAYKIPFFKKGIEEYGSRKNNIILFTFEQYRTYLENYPQIAPKGFIFHTSRSGSTLVSQMLTELSNTRVVAEAPIFNQYLIQSIVLKNKIFNKQNLASICYGYGVAPSDQTINIFFKFSSWLIHLAPIIFELFPNTPWIYIYRNPVEVIVSNILKRSYQVKLHQKPSFAAFLTKIPIYEVATLSEEQLLAKILLENMKAAINVLPSDNGLVVKYKQLKSIFFPKIIPHFNLQPNQLEIDRILERSKYYSKSKDKQIFTSDSKEKQASSTRIIREVVQEMRLENVISQLEGFKI